MEYYFTNTENIDIENGFLVITDNEKDHLIKVLRKKTGDRIDVTDGKYSVYKVEILNIDKNKIHCGILDIKRDLYEPEIKIVLCIAPLKNLSRFEFAIEKAVELGVFEIQPVLTEHTVLKLGINNQRIERLNKIIKSAIKQSQRCYLPAFKNAVELTELLQITTDCKNKIVMYEHTRQENKMIEKSDEKRVYLLIGPEGGFSEKEIELLKENKWVIDSLGKR